MVMTYRDTKGSELSHAEGDANFRDLDQRMGWADYNDLATTASPIALTLADTNYQLTNDGLGANTRTEHQIDGNGDIWDSVTDTLDFSDLAVGDVITIRGDVTFHSTGVNRFITMFLELGTGSGSDFLLPVAQGQFKAAGSNQIVGLYSFYIGAEFIRANPARLLAQSDGAGDSITVNGWFIRTERR